MQFYGRYYLRRTLHICLFLQMLRFVYWEKTSLMFVHFYPLPSVNLNRGYIVLVHTKLNIPTINLMSSHVQTN